MATFKTVGGKNYTLSSSITSTQTTITLSSFTLPVTDQAITMATAGTSIMYGTIQPGSTNSELISFTGVTQNANGTATLTGVTRGLDRETPYEEVSDFKLPHPGQSIFILSDAPQVFNSYTAKVNDETITGSWSFPTPSLDDNPATKEYVDGIAIAGSPDASTTVKGIGRVSVAPVSATIPIFVGDNDGRVPTQDENDALEGTSGTPSNTNKYVTNDDTSVTAAASKVVRASSGSKIDPAYIQNFTGDGSDGALTVSSGTTNIDLGSAQFVVKQYTSISITGTGAVTFSNPHASGTVIVIKCQGNATLTSSATPMLDFSGLGGAGGTGGTGTQIGSGTNGGNAGTSGTQGTNIQDALITHAGTSTSSNTSAATAGTQLTAGLYTLSDYQLLGGQMRIACGSGGGGGQGANNQNAGVVSGGAGGRGGGAVVMQVGGAWNFTTTNGISVSGKNGSNGAASSSFETNGGAGAGGGGSAGMFIGIYNTLTANTGSVSATGGAGGTGGNATDTAGGSGGNAAPGAGGSGAGSLAAAGAIGATNGIGINNNGTTGVAGGVGSGGSGGGGAFAGYNSTSTYTGGAGGAAGATAASTQVLITKNYFLA